MNFLSLITTYFEPPIGSLQDKGNADPEFNCSTLSQRVPPALSEMCVSQLMRAMQGLQSNTYTQCPGLKIMKKYGMSARRQSWLNSPWRYSSDNEAIFCSPGPTPQPVQKS